LAELFEQLPEVGDQDQPRLVFFFDEAHLLFEDAPKALVDKVEQVVRLIRSKGVGDYFVTQNPLDIPESVLAQLGNRVQHALRAFTPRDQRAVKVAAETFRPNPRFSTAAAITEMGVGEALISLLDEKGRPSVVERALVRPPDSRLGPITPDERRAIIAASPVAGRYDAAVDRESAFEMLQGRLGGSNPPATGRGRTPQPGPAPAPPTRRGPWSDPQPPEYPPAPAPAPYRRPTRAPARQRESVEEAFFKSMARTLGGSVGRTIARGVLGSISRR
ncbi:MAG: helicase HerA-like domain-containing protein, partial [Alphaproteobacteria bacterium]